MAGALGLLLAAALLLRPELRLALGGWLVAGAGPPGAEPARVQRVIDGDTLVTADGRTIRLLGVDTPETVNPNMAHAQPLGAEAADRLRGLVEGRTVLLEPDVTDADHYGRSLRHVWLGDALVAEILVREGLGRANTIPPDTRHADRLRGAETEARLAGRGLWSLARPTPLAVFRETTAEADRPP